MKRHPWALIIVLVAVLAAGLYYWLLREPGMAIPPPATPAAVPAPAPIVAAPSAPPAASGIQHPIESPEAAAGADDAESILADLLGRRTVLAMFNVEGFPRRFAATVDNLGRSVAPAAVWPVRPTPDRFLTARKGDAEMVSADNSLRYTPFVLMVEGIDAKRAVAAYRRL